MENIDVLQLIVVLSATAGIVLFFMGLAWSVVEVRKRLKNHRG